MLAIIILSEWQNEWMINYMQFLTLMLMNCLLTSWFFHLSSSVSSPWSLSKPCLFVTFFLWCKSHLIHSGDHTFRRSNFISVHCHAFKSLATLTDIFVSVPNDPDPSWRPGACTHCKKLKVRRDPVYSILFIQFYSSIRLTSLKILFFVTDMNPLLSFSLLPGLFRPVIFFCKLHPRRPCQLRFPDPIQTSMLRIPNTPSGPGVNRWNVTFQRAKIHANGAKMADMSA